MLRSMIIMLIVCCFARTARGQYGLVVGVRARVQTTVHRDWSYGHVVSWDRSGVLLDPCGACEGRNIPLDHILRLQVSEGRTGRSYALEGAIAGAIGGAVLGHLVEQRRGGAHGTNDMFTCARSCARTLDEVLGGFFGVLAGTTAGAFVRREGWSTVSFVEP
jgi:hypothetical protein